MLSHGRKGQGCHGDADGGASEAGSLGKVGDQVDVKKEQEAIAADVDETKGHAVFFSKVAGVARVRHQMAEALKAPSVEDISGYGAEGKCRQEKKGGKAPVRLVKVVVNDVVRRQSLGRLDSHGPVHEIKYKKAEDPKGKAAVVKVIALVPRPGSGKDGREHEGQQNGKQDGQDHSGDRQPDLSVYKIVSQGVAEQEFTDKGGKGGGEHTDVEVLLEIQPLPLHIKKGSQKARPHV